MEKENEKKESLEPLDIDKQLWLAKQKELSELEIIKRKKKRNWYKTKGRIILVIFIIVMIIMNRCEVQVENQNSEQKIAAYQEKNFLYLNNQNIGGGRNKNV